MAIPLRRVGFLCFIPVFLLLVGYVVIDPETLSFHSRKNSSTLIIVHPNASNSSSNVATIKEVKYELNNLDEQDQEAQKQMAQHPLPMADLVKEAQVADSKHNSTQGIGKTIAKFIGDIMTLVPLGLPFVYYWSTGNLRSTVELYSKAALLSTALSTYGWVLYLVSEVSFNDKPEIVGVDAVIVNSIAWGVLSFYMLFIVIHGNQLVSGKYSAWGICGYIVRTALLVGLPLFKPFKSTDKSKLVIGVIAGVLQAAAQVLPLYFLYQTWRDGPPGPEAQIRNLKKLTVLARSTDTIVSLYWMVYCILTYNFDAFGIASIGCFVLSLLSLVVHSAWAIRPLPPPPPPPAPVV